MASPTTFHEQRRALEASLANYDKLVADGAGTSALAAAEHQIRLASDALSMELTPPGVFVLDNVFQVGCLELLSCPYWFKQSYICIS